MPPGGRFIWSSTQYGAGDVNTATNAFGLWANPANVTNFSYARRFFAGGALTAGQKFSLDIAPSTQSGSRGVSILDGQTNVLVAFTAGSVGGYTVGGTSLGWTYSQSSVFNLSVLQTAPDAITFTLVRGTDTFTTNLAGNAPGFPVAGKVARNTA